MKATHNGHCQVCGRTQAVKNGLAKHGYTVEYGWFNGVCPGAHLHALEHDRSTLDETIDQLVVEAHRLDGYGPDDVAFVEVPEFAYSKQTKKVYGPEELNGQTAARNLETWNYLVGQKVNDWHAEAAMMRRHAARLAALAAEIHGQPLIPREQPPELERFKKYVSNMPDAYKLANELRRDGWKPRVSRGLHPSVTATRPKQ